MTRPIITFTTDFGEGSPYVAEMKGVALALCPEAQLVDISHGVPPQNVRCGARYLAQVANRFPAGSVHVAVVDPGVGTGRKIVVVRARGQTFVAPDNGLLSLVAPVDAIQLAVEANQEQFWQKNVSRTFHGRDIMTPLAAHVSNGVELEELGTKCDQLVELSWPKPLVTAARIEGEVTSIDSFGNLISNVNATDLAERNLTGIRCGSASIEGLVQAYAEQKEGELVALIGSCGWLEIAQVRGNAAKLLGVEVGEAIYLDTE